MKENASTRLKGSREHRISSQLQRALKPCVSPGSPKPPLGDFWKIPKNVHLAHASPNNPKNTARRFLRRNPENASNQNFQVEFGILSSDIHEKHTTHMINKEVQLPIQPIHVL